ncbi:MAG: hypothetical protein A2086_03820 [Spirochaetes bacterium GWD1_27_9]|nr:MAG: hypothetical protein A2Y34_15190 [Spirochaetes bacterium GWC1_27_15]OHD30672.1 MAG: hypothetical protein A2086_03820 [Spirochaetes bacterium GWD1_27_9]
MTLIETKKIIELLKHGRYFVQEDSYDSMINRWKYIQSENIFLFEQQDTIAGGLINEFKYNEDEFIEILLNNYEFKEFFDHIAQINLD